MFVSRGVWAVLVGGLLVSGCDRVGSPGAPGVINMTAAGDVDMKPGSEEEFMLDVGRRIYFDQGSAVVSDEAQMTVVRQAEWLKKNPRWLVKVQGHADDPGGDAANKALSEKRAEAVMAALVALGVEGQRMWAKGYGIERPVTNCAPTRCEAENRSVVVNLRVEFDDSAPSR